jgi:hypothetical protein
LLAGFTGLELKRPTGFRKPTSSRKIFSTVKALSANGRFQVRDRDGAMTERGAKPQAARRRERPVPGSDLPIGNDEVGSKAAYQSGVEISLVAGTKRQILTIGLDFHGRELA